MVAAPNTRDDTYIVAGIVSTPTDTAADAGVQQKYVCCLPARAHGRARRRVLTCALRGCDKHASRCDINSAFSLAFRRTAARAHATVRVAGFDATIVHVAAKDYQSFIEQLQTVVHG